MSLDVLRKSRPRITEVKISSGIVHVKSLSGAQRHLLGIGKMDSTDLAIAGATLCDQDGKALFSRPEIAKAELEQMEGDDVKEIAKAVYRASNIKVKDDNEGEDAPDPSTASPN